MIDMNWPGRKTYYILDASGLDVLSVCIIICFDPDRCAALKIEYQDRLRDSISPLALFINTVL